MRLLSIIVVGLALTIVIATCLERWESPRQASESLLFDVIRITGTGNTLASIARHVNDPKRFQYDPKTRIAVSNATLVIEGELQLGVLDDPDSGECLEMATVVCGDLRIEVRPGGVLGLYHSTIRTVSQTLSNTACSGGFSLFVDGTLIMDHGRVNYLSGSTSQCLRGEARATIRQSTFSYCDGSALSCINIDGSRIVIDQSEIIGSGNWGLVVRGSGGAPLEVRNSVIDGQVGAVFLTGESAKVRLVDCVFDPSKIMFNRPSGQVIIAWTRRFQVLEAKTKLPRAGVLVRAESINGSGQTEVIEAHTDSDGNAEMILTDWIAQRGGAAAEETSDQAARHRISVIGEHGEVLATIAELTVQGKDRNPVVVELQ